MTTGVVSTECALDTRVFLVVVLGRCYKRGMDRCEVTLVRGAATVCEAIVRRFRDDLARDRGVPLDTGTRGSRGGFVLSLRVADGDLVATLALDDASLRDEVQARRVFVVPTVEVLALDPQTGAATDARLLACSLSRWPVGMDRFGLSLGGGELDHRPH